MSKDIEVLAERVNWLMEKCLKPDGSTYSYREVEEGTEQQGHRVDSATLWRIRNAKTNNPGYLTIEALARFFGIDDPATLWNDTLSEEEFLALVGKSLRTAPLVQKISLRAFDLSERDQELILNLIKSILDKEEAKNASES